MSAAEAMGLEQFRAIADEAEPQAIEAEEADSLASCDLGTDLDASRRLVETYLDEIRFCPGVGWLTWDGARWVTESEGRVMEMAKKSARAWTVAVASGTDIKAKRQSLNDATKLEFAGHLKGAVELAKSDPRVAVSSTRLDRDQWLLNVQNGTLDLRTGTLQPHNRADLITRLAPTVFDPNAKHPALDRFLATIAAGDAEMPGFIARLCGMTLTGDCEAESLIINQGDGGSGKTTLAEALASVLGDYAVKIGFSSLCTSKYGRAGGSNTPDLVPLRGARMAYASEGDASARLDAGVVKQLTGNEPLTACAKYKDPITFPQTWKIWLFTNYDPKTDSEDTGIWRRMVKVHFHAIPAAERDPAVKRALTKDPAALSALLAWAVKGCADWQGRGGGRNGLALPKSVLAETEAYRVKQDSLAEWWSILEADAEFFPRGFTSHRVLRGHYEDWCKEEGYAFPVAAKRFKEYLDRRGLAQDRNNSCRGWRGIEL